MFLLPLLLYVSLLAPCSPAPPDDDGDDDSAELGFGGLFRAWKARICASLFSLIHCLISPSLATRPLLAMLRWAARRSISFSSRSFFSYDRR